LVALGAADKGIGQDQGKSIRIPASFCGLYGFKATSGLERLSALVALSIKPLSIMSAQ
jgi:Asp-tRNA(Asn)/Glu-tRNA(Gln) amidotransferase A subunit family amidase